MILISSDHHHWNYDQFATTIYRGVNNRLAESLAVEDVLHEIARRYQCRYHIRCGDLFEKKNILDAVALSEVSAKLRRNLEAGIEEIIIPGNHDAAAGGERTTLEALPTGVRLIAESTTIRIGSFSILFVPYIERGFIDAASRLVDSLSSNRGRLVLVGHVGVVGARAGSEYALPGEVNLHGIWPSQFEAIFLGHVHHPQPLCKNAWYVGAIRQRNFADSGAQPRCILFDESSGRMESILLPGPSFETVEVSNVEDLMSSFQPDERTYYKVKILDPYVKWEALKPLFDDRCLGWVVHYEGRSDRHPKVRLSTTSATRWEDILSAYVQKVSSTLDKSQLLDIGQELIRDGPCVVS